MKYLKTLLPLLAAMLLCGSLSAQIIWSLDFNDPALNNKGAIGPGPIIDVAGAPFTVDVSAGLLSDAADWFKVTNQVFEARDVDGPCVWLSENIDISGAAAIDLSLVITEVGDHEAADYVDVEYIVDGFPVFIANWNGFGSATHTFIGDIPNDGDWGTQTVFISGITGSNLQIRVTMDNGSGAEYLQLDDIVVSTTPVPVTYDLQITEVHYNPNDLGGYPDADYEFIEIHNYGATTIDLEDWEFDDAVIFAFPAGSSIDPGEYIVICSNAATYSGNGYQVFEWDPATLPDAGGSIDLFDADGETVDQVSYSASSPWPIQANGYGPSLELTTIGSDNSDPANWHSYNCQGQPDPNGTPGAANSTPGLGCTDIAALNFDPCAFINDGSCVYTLPSIAITEVHYNPCVSQGLDPDYEFLELHNYGAVAIDLEDWEFDGAVTFTFPGGSSIAPGEYIVICSNAATYSGNGYQVFQWDAGQALNNTNETVLLYDDSGATVESFTYSDVAPWPTEADGGCPSAELIDPLSDNTLGTNWQASYIFGGTPGAPNSSELICADCGVGASVDSYLSDDFEDGDISDWTLSGAGDWAADLATPIYGTASLAHQGLAGNAWASFPIGYVNAADACTRWSFSATTGTWNAGAANQFYVYLLANEADLGSATVDGVAFGANAAGTLGLFQMTDGAPVSTLVTFPMTLPQDAFIDVEVLHTEDSQWIVKLDVDGGADLFLGATQPTPAVDLAEGRYFGVYFACDAAGAGQLRFDDIDVSQCGVSEVYYSVATGDLTDAVWNTDPNAAVGNQVTFTKFKDMVIRNGATITFDEDLTVRNLSLENINGLGTLDADAAIVRVKGDFMNDDGNLVAGSSTFMMQGEAAQLIGGSTIPTFENLTISNSFGVSMSDAVNVHGVLLPQEGAFDTDGNVLTLTSDALGTGSVGTIAAAASFSGTVNAQRYIPSGVQSWVNLGSPIPGLTLEAWNDDLITTGFPGSDFPDYAFNDGTLFVNVLHYDETVAGLLNEGFVGPTDITDPLMADRGYMVFMTGSTQMVEVEGSIQQGSLNTALNYTSTGVPANDGWELVVNRYPSEIDFDALYALSTNIAPNYYIYDAENGVYSFYTVGVGGTASGFIPSGQSFWVQTLSAGASLQFEEDIKSNMGVAFERDFPEISKITMRLQRDGQSHHTTLVIDESSSLEYESGVDAFALGSINETAPMVACVATDGELTSMNRLSFGDNISIPVHIKAVAGEFTFEVIDLENIPDGYCLSLEDLETGVIYPIDEEINIEWTQEEDFEGQRFMIHAVRPIESVASNISCNGEADGSIEVSSNVGEGTIELRDLDGTVLASATAGENTTFDNLTEGDYEVVFISPDESCTSVSEWFYIEEPLAVSIATPESINADLVAETVEVEIAAEVANADVITWSMEGQILGYGNSIVIPFDEAGSFVVEASASAGSCTSNSSTIVNILSASTVATDLVQANVFVADGNLIANDLNTGYQTVMIFDASGRLVAQYAIDNHQGDIRITLETISNGLYTAILVGNELSPLAVKFVR